MTSHAPGIALRALIVMALALGASFLGSCTRTHSDGASPQREVLLYCSVDEDIARPIIEDFQKRHRVRVIVVGEMKAGLENDLAERLRSGHEQEAAPADVYWTGDAFEAARVASQGALAPIELPSFRDWPARWRGEEDRWFGFAVRGRVIVFHSERLTESAAPDQLIDLIDPRFRNRVVIARPESGRTRGHFAALYSLWGETPLREWLGELKRNGARLVDDDFAVVQAVAEGEALIGLTNSDDVHAGQGNGWPVAMKLANHAFTAGASFSMIDMTLAGPLLIPNAAARVVGGPNEAEALELIEYLLSPNVERRLAAGRWRATPIHATVRADFPEHAMPLRNKFDRFESFEAMERDADRAVAIVREVLER